MSQKLFSVVVPTIGRASLPQTLASIRNQDIFAEILLVADTFEMGDDIRAAIQHEARQWGARYLEVDAGHHDWGSPQLQEGYRQATGAFVHNMGDDDVLEPLAYVTMQRAIGSLPEPIPMMFRTVLHPSPVRGNQMPVVLWVDPELRNRNITGQCFVIPNDQSKIGSWSILVDFGFITDTVRLWDGKVAWRTEVISQCF